MVLTHASYYQGASHIADNKPVQDRAASLDISYGDGRHATALLLSDGHGNDIHFRSDVGAALAIEAAVEALPYILEVLPSRMNGKSASRGIVDSACLVDTDRTPADPECESAMRMFFTRINALWAKKVLGHWNSNPQPDQAPNLSGVARAYGCTLIGAVRADGFWFAFQLGDGACTCITSESDILSPIPGDSRCAMSRTTSMCIHGAGDFRYSYGTDIPPAMMICSDGLADCFENHDELASKILAQIVLDNSANGFDSVEADITGSMPELSRQFTGDDMSIALWIDTEATEAILPSLDRLITMNCESELSQAILNLQSCEESIVDIEDRISSLSPTQADEAGEIERKLSVLSTLKRHQRELLDRIDSIKLNLDNRL